MREEGRVYLGRGPAPQLGLGPVAVQDKREEGDDLPVFHQPEQHVHNHVPLCGQVRARGLRGRADEQVEDEGLEGGDGKGGDAVPRRHDGVALLHDLGDGGELAAVVGEEDQELEEVGHYLLRPPHGPALHDGCQLEYGLQEAAVEVQEGVAHLEVEELDQEEEDALLEEDGGGVGELGHGVHHEGLKVAEVVLDCRLLCGDVCGREGGREG